MAGRQLVLKIFQKGGNDIVHVELGSLMEAQVIKWHQC